MCCHRIRWEDYAPYAGDGYYAHLGCKEFGPARTSLFAALISMWHGIRGLRHAHYSLPLIPYTGMELAARLSTDTLAIGYHMLGIRPSASLQARTTSAYTANIEPCVPALS